VGFADVGDFNGWLGRVNRASSARSGHGCPASLNVGQSEGLMQSAGLHAGQDKRP